jgi:hypothetical protein
MRLAGSDLVLIVDPRMIVDRRLFFAKAQPVKRPRRRRQSAHSAPKMEFSFLNAYLIAR